MCCNSSKSRNSGFSWFFLLYPVQHKYINSTSWIQCSHILYKYKSTIIFLIKYILMRVRYATTNILNYLSLFYKYFFFYFCFTFCFEYVFYWIWIPLIKFFLFLFLDFVNSIISKYLKSSTNNSMTNLSFNRKKNHQ